MKLIKIVNAYMALNILAKEKLKFKDALCIVFARNNLKSSYDFFAKTEAEIVESVAKKDETGKPIRYPDGHFEFTDDKSKELYFQNMEELSSVEVGDEEYTTITISPPETITAELLEALEGFVIFKEESNEGTS